MFLASVLIGDGVEGNSSMQRPPPRDPATPWLIYDCTVDKLPDPTIYVIYDNTQCYPQFLVEYKTVDEGKKASAGGVERKFTPIVRKNPKPNPQEGPALEGNQDPRDTKEDQKPKGILKKST